jgi:AcrR family transcriptional regulator
MNVGKDLCYQPLLTISEWSHSNIRKPPAETGCNVGIGSNDHAELGAPMRAAFKHRPRTKPPEERRDDLMNAAQKLFLENGIAATTIDQITSAANVAKGTFYLHFRSKEDVLGALRERFVQDYLAGLAAALDGCDANDWNERLAAWVRAGICGYLDAVALHDIVFHEYNPDAREQSAGDAVFDHLESLIDAGTKAGAWAVDDPQRTAVFLFYGLHGAVDHALATQKRIRRAELIEGAQELFFRVVKARG